uniref:Uncharacterized protein n=1 Tax=Timema poppense TaxID=170557 RepID=A0A7R9DIG9_TIMPO|nr:unnamed protein product [Timema poppensis]
MLCDLTWLCDFMRSITPHALQVLKTISSVVAVSLPRDIPVSTTVSLQGGGGLVNQLRRSYSLSDLSSDKDSIPDLGRTRALTDTPEDEVDDGSMPTGLSTKLNVSSSTIHTFSSDLTLHGLRGDWAGMGAISFPFSSDLTLHGLRGDWAGMGAISFPFSSDLTLHGLQGDWVGMGAISFPFSSDLTLHGLRGDWAGMGAIMVECVTISWVAEWSDTEQLVADTRHLRPRGYSPRRSSSGSGRVEMYFPEVDVDVRPHGAPRDPNMAFSQIRSSEDVSSGYSSAEPLYGAPHPSKGENLITGREPLMRTASVGGSARSIRNKSTRGGAVAKKSTVPEQGAGQPRDAGKLDSPDEQPPCFPCTVFLVLKDSDRSDQDEASEGEEDDDCFYDVPTSSPPNFPSIPASSPPPSRQHAQSQPIPITHEHQHTPPQSPASSQPPSPSLEDNTECDISSLNESHHIDETITVDLTLEPSPEQNNITSLIRREEAPVPDHQVFQGSPVDSGTPSTEGNLLKSETQAVAETLQTNDDTSCSELAEISSAELSPVDKSRPKEVSVGDSSRPYPEIVISDLNDASPQTPGDVVEKFPKNITLGSERSDGLNEEMPSIQESINHVINVREDESISANLSETTGSETKNESPELSVLDNIDSAVITDSLVTCDESPTTNETMDRRESSLSNKDSGNTSTQIKGSKERAASLPRETLETLAKDSNQEQSSGFQDPTHTEELSLEEGLSSSEALVDLKKDGRAGKYHKRLAPTPPVEERNQQEPSAVEFPTVAVETVSVETNMDVEVDSSKESVFSKDKMEDSLSMAVTESSMHENIGSNDHAGGLRTQEPTGEDVELETGTFPPSEVTKKAAVGVIGGSTVGRSLTPSPTIARKIIEDEEARVSQGALTARLVLKPGVVRNVGPEGSSEVFVSTSPKLKRKNSGKKKSGESPISRLLLLPRSQLSHFTSLFPFWHHGGSPQRELDSASVISLDESDPTNRRGSSTSACSLEPVVPPRKKSSSPVSLRVDSGMGRPQSSGDLTTEGDHSSPVGKSILKNRGGSFRLRNMSHSPAAKRKSAAPLADWED